MKLYMAMMESESYTWVAFGTSPNRAKKAIKKRWDEFNPYAEPMTLDQLEEAYEIKVIEVVKDKCYIDFE